MISINLLPPECRKKTSSAINLRLPNKKWLMGAGAILGVLTCVFCVQYFMNRAVLKNLEAEWITLAGDVRRVTQQSEEMDKGVKEKKKFLERYVATSLAATTLLDAVSELLPDSLWLIEVKISRTPSENTFLLKGLAVPLQGQSSIETIEKYLSALKKKFPQDTELILTTSRQIKENRELTLFTAIFKWL